MTSHILEEDHPLDTTTEGEVLRKDNKFQDTKDKNSKYGRRSYDDVLIPEKTEEDALLRITPTLENTEAITLKTTEV